MADAWGKDRSVETLVHPLIARGVLPALKHSELPILGITEVFKLLVETSKTDMDYDFIESRFDLDRVQVENVKTYYLKIHEKTAFDPMSIVSGRLKNDEDPGLILKDSLSLIPRLNALIEIKSEALEDMLAMWRSYVDPKKTFWFF